tara:strand:+ start:520 stop:1446 length:927 start_codon:yes stop_codon:yes gene_type:complete
MLNICTKLFAYNEIFNHLINLDKANKLPSRILISGQEGIGKTTFAFHFINYLFSKNEIYKYNSEKNIINSQSISFSLVKNMSHPNLFLISKNNLKKNIEIEQIRNMINFINKSSFNDKKKIILIDGAENLNSSSSNALLKSLEESSAQNIFILTHNINLKILDTIKSRCINYKLNFDYAKSKSIINNIFDSNTYDLLNNDFKLYSISPKFLINHIIFIQQNGLDLATNDAISIINYIVDKKLYKKDDFVINNFQSYLEIFLMKMYSKTHDYRYYDSLLESVFENNLVNKFNLDLDSFFIKFRNKYLKI